MNGSSNDHEILRALQPMLSLLKFEPKRLTSTGTLHGTALCMLPVWLCKLKHANAHTHVQSPCLKCLFPSAADTQSRTHQKSNRYKESYSPHQLRRCSLRWALGVCRREEPVSNFLRTRRTKLLRGARRGKVLRSWRTKLPRCRLPRGAWRGRLRQRPQSDCRAFKGTRGAFQGTRGTLECSLSHGLQRIAKVQAVRGSLSLGMAIFVFAMAMVMGVTVVGG